MADPDFIQKYQAHRAHMAAVPGALARIEDSTWENGQPMVDAAEPRVTPTCGDLRTLVAEVQRLQALVQQQQKDAIEEQREFSREARQIADEARWDERERNSHD